MLLNGKGPEVSGEPALLQHLVHAGAMPSEVLIEQESAEPEVPALMHDAEQYEASDGSEIGPGCGLDSKETADVEGLQVEMAERGFIFQDAPADKNAADGEEEIHTIAAETAELYVAVAERMPAHVVRHDDPKDGNGTPAVKTGQIA